MDFSKINTAADAETGGVLHLKHPQLGHKLYTGEGANEVGELVDAKADHQAVLLTVRGLESDYVQNRLGEAKKKAMRNPEDEDTGLELVISLIIDIKGVTNGEQVISATPDDLKWFFKRSDDFVRQVMAFAREPANFFQATAKR